MSKATCKQCGCEVQQATALRNAGLCQPCAKGFVRTTCRQCGKEFRSEGGRYDVCFNCNPPAAHPTAPAPAEMIVDVVLKSIRTNTSEEQTIANLKVLGLERTQAIKAIEDIREGSADGAAFADIESATGLGIKGYAEPSQYFVLARRRASESARPPGKWWQFWR